MKMFKKLIVGWILLLCPFLSVATAQTDSYWLSINVSPNHERFFTYSANLIKDDKVTYLKQSEVRAYGTIFFNTPKDTMWADCAEGYKLTKAKSRTGSEIFPMDESGRVDTFGILFAKPRRTHNLTILCSR
jgi:hypothetical protein